MFWEVPNTSAPVLAPSNVHHQLPITSAPVIAANTCTSAAPSIHVHNIGLCRAMILQTYRHAVGLPAQWEIVLAMSPAMSLRVPPTAQPAATALVLRAGSIPKKLAAQVRTGGWAMCVQMCKVDSACCGAPHVRCCAEETTTALPFLLRYVWHSDINMCEGSPCQSVMESDQVCTDLEAPNAYICGCGFSYAWNLTSRACRAGKQHCSDSPKLEKTCLVHPFLGSALAPPM